MGLRQLAGAVGSSAAIAVAGGLLVALVAGPGCEALSRPLPADPETGEVPQREDPGFSQEVPVDVDKDGEPDGTVTIDLPGSGPRDATVGDVVLDAVGTIGGAVSGNPLLWGTLTQLAGLGLSLFRRRKSGE